MFIVQTITTVPTASSAPCFITGLRKLPLLNDRLLDALNTSMMLIRHRKRNTVQITASPLNLPSDVLSFSIFFYGIY